MGRHRWLGLGSLGWSTLAASLAIFWWRLVNPLDCLPVIFDAAPSQLAECANRAQVFQAIWLPLTLVGGLVLALLTWLVEVARLRAVLWFLAELYPDAKVDVTPSKTAVEAFERGAQACGDAAKKLRARGWTWRAEDLDYAARRFRSHASAAAALDAVREET